MPRIVFSSAGSSPRKASGSKFGIEKGLCEKSIFFSSSFHSYIGKSTIQQNSKTFSQKLFNYMKSLVRVIPAKDTNLLGTPATKKTASPTFNRNSFNRYLQLSIPSARKP